MSFNGHLEDLLKTKKDAKDVLKINVGHRDTRRVQDSEATKIEDLICKHPNSYRFLEERINPGFLEPSKFKC